ncbi:MAG: diacylglycerol kinase family protein [Bryobacteraceae bacterium]
MLVTAQFFAERVDLFRIRFQGLHPTSAYNGSVIDTYQQSVLIYNPVAGKLRRDRERFIERSKGALARAGLRPEFWPTSGAGDATELARRAVRDGVDLVLVAGGDGTINEVANGMVGSAVPLGILPAGTANVLAMELQFGGNLELAAERLAKCEPTRIAVGRLNGAVKPRHFLLMAGVGLDARIVSEVSSGLKAKAGKLAYWVAGFSQMARLVDQFDVVLDGEPVRCGFALISRVRNYGGDVEIATGASLRSGEFEVVLIRGSIPLKFTAFMVAAFLRQATKMPGVTVHRVKKVELLGGAQVQLDGEHAGWTPASVEIVPDALTLLMPAGYR